MKSTTLQSLSDLVAVFYQDAITPEQIVELSKRYLPPSDGQPILLSNLRDAVHRSAMLVLDSADPFKPPRWEDAPTWAEYLAQDYDCRWYWYAGEPAPLPEGVWSPVGGLASMAKVPMSVSANSEWKTTLQRRPAPAAEQES